MPDSHPTGPQDRRPYSQLSQAEKWEWHADVYAFRCVYLGIVQMTSPCDPDGAWYNQGLIDAAIARKRREIAERTRDQHVASMARDHYARSVGFTSWSDRHDAIARNMARYAAAEEWRNSQAGQQALKGFQTPAQALGVKAREWTPEEMSQARAQLGFDGS
jgi:hypothetical protein